MPKNPLRLAVSMGDPAGIGLPLFVKFVKERKSFPGVEVGLYVDQNLYQYFERKFGKVPEIIPKWTTARLASPAPTIRDLLVPGSLLGAQTALESIQKATQAVLDGRADALVTLPVTKNIFEIAGLPYYGHTHYLGALCEEAGHPKENCKALMTMVAKDLRVALVTDHLRLSEVPAAVTTEEVRWCLDVLGRESRLLGIRHPRIAVCGLNPHAGEGGLLGDEDACNIAPAVAAARKSGLDATGPLAADSLFFQARKGIYDWVLALYHDQGLGPLKTLAFHSAVNVTLGLPIIRTSPDHGVAYDLAPKGEGDPSSIVLAVKLAVSMAKRKRSGKP